MRVKIDKNDGKGPHYSQPDRQVQWVYTPMARIQDEMTFMGVI